MYGPWRRNGRRLTPPRKTHCAQGGRQQVKLASAEGALRPGSGNATGNDGGGLAKSADRPGYRSAAQSNRPVPDTLLPGAGWRNSERRIWGWRRAQLAQGETCRVTGVRGQGRGSQRDQRPRRQPARRWKLRRNRERPVRCCQMTGACGICGPVNAVQQLCRIGNGGQQLMINSNPSARGQRSRSTAPQVNPLGKGAQRVPCCFQLPPPRFSPWGTESA